MNIAELQQQAQQTTLNSLSNQVAQKATELALAHGQLALTAGQLENVTQERDAFAKELAELKAAGKEEESEPAGGQEEEPAGRPEQKSPAASSRPRGR